MFRRAKHREKVKTREERLAQMQRDFRPEKESDLHKQWELWIAPCRETHQYSWGAQEFKEGRGPGAGLQDSNLFVSCAIEVFPDIQYLGLPPPSF